MPKIFCPNCYTANSYTDRPGKCCHECGKPFLESSASIPSQNIPVRKPIIEEPPKKIRTPKTLKGVRTRVDDDEYGNEQEVEIDDDGEVVSVPNIDKLEVEIVGNYKPNTSKFEQVAGTGKTGEGRERNLKAKSPSKSQIKKDFQKLFPKLRESKDISE